MNVQSVLAGLGDRAPLAVAFLSSTAIEVVAVAVLLTLIVQAVARGATAHRPALAKARRKPVRASSMPLHKLIIPVLSLGVTVWVWTATRGA